jgi:hypothetical protein
MGRDLLVPEERVPSARYSQGSGPKIWQFDLGLDVLSHGRRVS